jgi:threonylcarbamoyladenosine tRNA methylthiotransferase MtaB
VRVFFTNLGCKLNQAENERLARAALAAGHHLALSLAEADLHVVNTCTVTATAARTSRKAARAAARAAPGRPARTVLTGCYATASPEEAACLAGVDLVVPNGDKERLLELVGHAFPEAAPLLPTSCPPTSPAFAPVPPRSTCAVPPPPSSAASPRPSPAPLSAPAVAPFPPLPSGNTRALVKVEDGCDMRCSFCIIPATRGRQRSQPLPDLVEEVRGLVAAGFREIVVTGVQISAYRAARGPSAGTGPDLRLADLVRSLLAALPSHREPPASPEARLRLTSIAPWELDDRLLELWADRRLCRHLHLSLQSGSTATLRRMRRPYTAERYARLIERLRAAVPGVAVTTDVIVGFPGETAGEFEDSLATVAALGFARVHVFPFSPRPGTAAAALPGEVPAPERQLRMARMIAAGDRAERDFHSAHLGQRATVLWERPRGGRGQGLTDNYIRVFAPPGDHPAAVRNRFSEVTLEALADGGMLGRVL